MGQLHTVRLDVDDRDKAAASRSLPATQVGEGYQRLGLVSAIIAGTIVVVLVVWWLESYGGVPHSIWEIVSLVVLLLVTLAVWFGARRGLMPLSSFPAVAVSTEALVAAGLGTGLMGWQYAATPSVLRWLEPGSLPPFDLGAGSIPLVGLWIVLFAAVIPLRPRLHLLGGLLSSVTLLLWPMVSVATLGMPPELVPVRLEATAQVAVWLFARGILATGIGYVTARSVYGLRRQLAQARQIGSYHLKEKLGEGGMGEVWRADHEMLARSAAIKLIKPGDTGGVPAADIARRFEREVRASAQLRSPHTIEIYDYGITEDGTFYYVMELLDGLDLEDLVRAHGPMPWRRAVHILEQMCHSLAEAHERGLVHRDIKPANIALCRMGRDVDQVKVLDFGLVKATTRTERMKEDALTQAGMFVGTPAYAAPEVATGGFDQASPAADLYSTGCVAFWLLSGQTVFQAATPMEVLMSHARDQASAPSSVTELEVPPELDAIVLSCLAKLPNERPDSADQLAQRLGALLGADWTQDEALGWWEHHRPAAVTAMEV